MLDERFHDEIDACRPGSRDLDEPEMSQLAEALTHDPVASRPLRSRAAARRAAGRSVCRGPGPSRSGRPSVSRPASRCRTPVANRRRRSQTTPAPVAPSVAGAINPVIGGTCAGFPCHGDRSHGLARSRRRVLAALAASLLVATGLWTAFRSPAAPAAGELIERSGPWFAGLSDQWQADRRGPGRSAAAGRHRRQSARVASRFQNRSPDEALSTAWRRGPNRGRSCSSLSARRPGLPAAAPLAPQSTTGGLTIGAWQSQGLVYVLVVEGDERAYRRFLNPGRQPLA